MLKELSGKGAISGLLYTSASDLGPEQTIAEISSGLRCAMSCSQAKQLHKVAESLLVLFCLCWGTKLAPSGEDKEKDLSN